MWEERNTSCFCKGKIKQTIAAQHFSKLYPQRAADPQDSCPLSPTYMQEFSLTALMFPSVDTPGKKFCIPKASYKCKTKQTVCHRSSANLIIWLQGCNIPTGKQHLIRLA